MSERLARLVAYWQGNCALSAGGTPESEVQLFEARYNVTLPPDMREYFLKLNGLDTNAFVDDDLYSFWQLRNVVPIAEWVPDRSHLFFESDKYFLFADHFISCPGFAIRLTSDSTEQNRIARVYSDFPKLEVQDFADSFTHFIDLYLTGQLHL